MSNVAVIRPGCTDYDEQHRIAGHLDLPLNERGRQQARALAEQLAGTPLSVIYTAPCRSARDTAKVIGETLNIPVKELEGLRNLNQGLWEGLTIEEVRRKYPKVYKQWKESPQRVCPPEGETVSEAMQRIRQALQKPCKRKQAFGVVASEPLATLISCVLTGSQPEHAPPSVIEADRPGVEWIQIQNKLPPEEVVSASGNGRHFLSLTSFREKGSRS